MNRWEQAFLPRMSPECHILSIQSARLGCGARRRRVEQPRRKCHSSFLGGAWNFQNLVGRRKLTGWSSVLRAVRLSSRWCDIPGPPLTKTRGRMEGLAVREPTILYHILQSFPA